jgi:beta-glucosidase
MSFPKDFIWGAAAASYQIEGAAHDDGKGDSTWDMMCRRPGKIWKNHTGDVACDHYHRYKEDVAIMKSLGLKAYRLSISWPRVMPDGDKTVNQKGLDFYSRLVDELLAAGIEPWVTLFHWDFPHALYLRGGWMNRCSSEWFAKYTEVIVDRLGDRVQNWMTLNEPICIIGCGHFNGAHAPGDVLPMREVLLVGHHVLMSHGRAVQVIRARAKKKPNVGFAPNSIVGVPATNDAADIAAARQFMFSVTEAVPWQNTWWMDPALKGEYPQDGLKVFGADAPKPQSGDMELIKQPLDFFGVNIYHGDCIKANKDKGFEKVDYPTGWPMTAFFWPVVPSSLYWGPKFLQERYKLPLVITENGMSNVDWVAVDGRVHDGARIDFMNRYLYELSRAAREGVDIRGYFHWSIMDNFEWGEGYKQRFGLVHVDYNTLKRTPKDSALWYRDTIASNGANLQRNDWQW